MSNPEKQVTRQHNTETTHWPTPEGWVDIDVYTPHSTPWDNYGIRHVNELFFVLTTANIAAQSFRTDRKTISPMGTGPFGRVRFGDDMQPSTYRVAVKIEDQEAARKALEDHRAAVKAWLYDDGPIPEACRRA